jgi:hypothetical protein
MVSTRLTVRRVLEALATYPDREELKREYPELQAASKGLHAKPISAETWKGSLEAMEVKTIPLKSSFQLVTELVVAHDRSSRGICHCTIA